MGIGVVVGTQKVEKAGAEEGEEELVGVEGGVDTVPIHISYPVYQLARSYPHTIEAPMTNPYALLLHPHGKSPQWRYKIARVNTAETINLCVRALVGIRSAPQRWRIGVGNLYRVK